MIDFDNINECVALAKYGQLPILNKLIKHKDNFVRYAIALRGYPHHLKILKDDPQYAVRVAVAKQGVYLDQFIKDEHEEVRGIAIMQGYHFNTFKKDRSPYIRYCAATTATTDHDLAYFLEDKDVNYIAKRVLVSKEYRLDILESNRHQDIRIRALAKQIQCNKDNPCAKQQYEEKLKHELDNYELNCEYIERDILSHKNYIKREIALQGIFLDQFLYDASAEVRRDVARQNYGLDILKDDPDEDVRKEVAMQGVYLDQFLHDPSEKVRREVAKQGYGLHILKDDPESLVKAEIINQNIELDKFKNDEDDEVKKALHRHHLQKYYNKEFDNFYLRWY